MTQSVPLVSVIIRTYNRAHKIQRALDSVLSQTFDDWELVIVDNNSVDDTDRVLHPFLGQQVRLFKINNNGIISASLNLGLSVARGKYVAILDSDDWWEPRKLELSVRILDLGFDVVHHHMNKVIAAGTGGLCSYSVQANRSLSRSDPYSDLYWRGNGVSNSSVVARKACLDSIGGFSEDPRVLGAEDYDTWLRMAFEGANFFCIDEALGSLLYDRENLSSADKTIRALTQIFSLRMPHPGSNRVLLPAWALYNTAMCRAQLGQRRHSCAAFLASILAPLPPGQFLVSDALTRAKSLLRLLKLLFVSCKV